MKPCIFRTSAAILAFSALVAPMASTKKVTITFMAWGIPAENKVIEQGLRDFEKQHPNIQVKSTYVPDYRPKLTTMFAAGTPPDVMQVESEVYEDWASRGLFMDLTSYLRSDRELSKPDYFVQPQENDRMYVGGKAYGIGSCWVAFHGFYNPTTFANAGLSAPSADPDKSWTWDNYLSIAKKLTKGPVGKPDTWGTQAGLGWWLSDFSFLSSIGSIYNRARTEYALDTPGMVSGLQRLVDLRTKQGCYPPSGVDAVTGLAKGKLGFYIDGSWFLVQLPGRKFVYGVAPLPMVGSTPSTLAQAHFHSIARTTKHKAEAWELMKYLSSDDYQMQLVKSGLWLPSHSRALKPEGIREWLNPAVHPADFEEIGIKYIKKYSMPIILPPGAAKANTVFGEAMAPVYQGKKDLKAALPDMLKRMNAALVEARKRVAK